MAATRQQAAKAQTKSSPLADDLIEALQDQRVVEALGKVLAPVIAKSIEGTIAPFLKQLEELNATVKGLKADNARLTTRCQGSEENITRLQKIVNDQNRRLDDIETYSRSDNIIIKGLPERSAAERASDAPPLDDNKRSLQDSYESVEATALNFFNMTLGVNVQPTDLSVAHRLKAGPKDKIRPIIVRFTNRKARIAVLRAKKSLKGSNDQIYISEHLTKAASDLFFKARNLLREGKIFGTWTQNGQIYVKFDPDPKARAELVKCEADLKLKP